MANGTSSVRRRGVRLGLAGMVATAVAVGGVTVAGAANGPAPAAAPVAPAAAPVAVAAAVPATTTMTLTAADGIALAPGDELTVTTSRTGARQYDVYYKIKRTARYPQTVFSEVTNEGRFNKIFPIRGAKANLGRVGTKHPLTVAGVPFPVTVSKLSSKSWQFKTRSPHPDHPGTVQFWLYKKGSMLKLHVRGICALCGSKAYLAVAYVQWLEFAQNIKHRVYLP